MSAEAKTPLLQVEQLKAFFDRTEILHGIDLNIQANEVVAFIGPSGCGKSTFLRCLNRLHEETPGATVSGKVTLQGEEVYGHGIDPVKIRKKMGMVFQKPNPFPSMSIFDNVAAGLRLNKMASGTELMVLDHRVRVDPQRKDRSSSRPALEKGVWKPLDPRRAHDRNRSIVESQHLVAVERREEVQI